MFEPLTHRRYLIPVKAAHLPQQFTDVLVIGGGVAGLRAAIAAGDAGRDVLLLTKDTIDQSNTWYAQGGIAAVLQPLDSFESHVSDTKIGGGGVGEEPAGRGLAMTARCGSPLKKGPSGSSNCSSGARTSTSRRGIRMTWHSPAKAATA